MGGGGDGNGKPRRGSTGSSLSLAVWFLDAGHVAAPALRQPRGTSAGSCGRYVSNVETNVGEDLLYSSKE